MKKLIFLILMIPFIFISCKSTEIEKCNFNGMIYDNDNEPVNDAKIYVNEKESTQSDIYGHFELGNLVYNNEYELRASKQGYEDVNLKLQFSNVSQFIYLRMYTTKQILSLCELAISEKDYKKANEYLNRASVIGDNKLETQYLRAVVLYDSKEYENAVDVLKKLLDEGYSEPYIYLLLADCNEYGLDNKDEAKKYLELFLENKYEPKVKERLSTL